MGQSGNQPNQADLGRSPTAVLEASWHGDHTVPVPGTYPHQWYTDSSLAAIGWSHIDPERGAVEIQTLLGGQWSNGMLPHQIYNKIPKNRNAINDAWMWGYSPLMPRGRHTSGITQPPILAEAAWTVAQALPADDRQAFLETVTPGIRDSHEWAYRERDFGREGLIATIHPYESGLNYSPYWIEHMEANPGSGFQRFVGRLPIEQIVKRLRPDVVNEHGEVSMSVRAGITAVLATLALGRLGYVPSRIEEQWPYQIEDVLFNSVLVRNNQVLAEMAEAGGIELSDELQANMRRTEAGLEKLYVPDADNSAQGQYYSRVVHGEHLRTLTISSLIPMYSGALAVDRADRIEAQLKDPNTFGLPYPVPTLPANSSNFNPNIQDEGAVKPPLNWLIVKGLELSGKRETAREIARHTLELAEGNEGSYGKYYSPITGEPGDQNRASSTAATAKDILSLANATLIVFAAAARDILRRRAA
jgi:hypothetical protein